jgi:hypothetical protein
MFNLKKFRVKKPILKEIFDYEYICSDDFIKNKQNKYFSNNRANFLNKNKIIIKKFNYDWLKFMSNGLNHNQYPKMTNYFLFKYSPDKVDIYELKKDYYNFMNKLAISSSMILTKLNKRKKTMYQKIRKEVLHEEKEDKKSS